MSTIDVTAAIPGVFYRTPGPGKDPYVVEGQAVATGDVIGLLEIMKQFAEVNATASGTLGSFLVEDGAMLNPGTVIATIEVS